MTPEPWRCILCKTTTGLSDPPHEICNRCKEAAKRSMEFDPPKTQRVTYSEQNNIYTCENGHGYSYHTIEANMLREDGFCQLCQTEARQAQGIVDVQLEVPLPYGIQMRGNMDAAAVKLLGAEICEVLKPIMLNKVVNPEYRGDLRLREEHKGVVEEFSHLKDQHKELLKEQHQALGLLWEFCDEVNKKPRHGNVFELAKEALAKLRDETHLLNKLAVADKAVMHCLKEHGNGSIAEDALEIMRTK